MGIVLVVVCLGAGLNLALWAALWRKVDNLPAAFLALTRRERANGEAHALTVLQEMAAGKVAAITLSLRSLEEQHIERNRNERAEAELRARVAERRASEAVPLLGTAAELARELRRTLDELRRTLDGLGELLTILGIAGEAARGPVTAVPDSGARRTDSAARETVPVGPGPREPEMLAPVGCATTAPPGEEGADDELTVVATRPAMRPPPQLDDAGTDQPEGRPT